MSSGWLFAAQAGSQEKLTLSTSKVKQLSGRAAKSEGQENHILRYGKGAVATILGCLKEEVSQVTVSQAGRTSRAASPPGSLSTPMPRPRPARSQQGTGYARSHPPAPVGLVPHAEKQQMAGASACCHSVTGTRGSMLKAIRGAPP